MFKLNTMFWASGFPGFVLESRALFARFTVPPNYGRKMAINTLIVSLKASGIWDKLDLLYLTAAADAQAGQCNWIDDLYNLAPVNAPSFVADRGYTGNGTSSYLDTNFTPSTQAVEATQNATTAFVWSRSSAQDLGALFGDSDANPALNFYSRYTDDTIYTRLNSTSDSDQPSTDGSGFWNLNRSASGTFDIWHNGSAVSTETASSTGLSGADLTLLRGSSADTDLSTSQIAAFGYGASLTPDERLALYNAISTYMVSVGAV